MTLFFIVKTFLLQQELWEQSALDKIKITKVNFTRIECSDREITSQGKEELEDAKEIKNVFEKRNKITSIQ